MANDALSFRTAADEYLKRAQQLLAALTAGDRAAAWRFKWEHPKFRGKTVDAVKTEELDLEDAKLVIAQQQSFATWADLVAFTEAVAEDGAVARFERAADAVVTGDADTLRAIMRDHPDIVHARSTRRHHVTLLHYIGANGVEGERQQTPANAIEIAKILLDAGAEVDALADLYDAKCTTMSMLVSSTHPAEAGLQSALAGVLLDYGAAFEGPGSNWQSAVDTALTFGYPDTAEALVQRGAPVNKLEVAAGLGRLADAERLLPNADANSRHAALALAAQRGHAPVVKLLLDAGEDPNRFNPDGYHSHGTPLHHAAAGNHLDVVRVLIEHGARLDIRDTIYQATPLGWAEYGKHTEMADYLRRLTPPAVKEN